MFFGLFLELVVDCFHLVDFVEIVENKVKGRGEYNFQICVKCGTWLLEFYEK